MKSTPKIILIVGIIFAVISPVLFTMLSHFECFDFTNTGQIGDTIGGLTSPIINLISAIIIYYSFNEQLKANQIQVSALNDEKIRLNNEKEYNYISILLIELEKRIDNFEYYDEFRPKTIEAQISLNKGVVVNQRTLYRGVNALTFFVKYAQDRWGMFFRKPNDYDLMEIPYFPEFYFIINEVKYIITEIQSTKHLDTESKEKLLSRTKFLFKCKLNTPVHILITGYEFHNKSDEENLFKEISRIYELINL